jgi:Fuc2NAc and GlcNAc transferase
MIFILSVACCSIFFGFFGAFLVSRHAEKLCLMDVPCDRSSHSRPTPKGGGAGILAAFVLFAFVGGLSFLAIASAVLLALVSFRGDKQELTPKFRLFVQFSCAALALWGVGLRVEPGWIWLVVLVPGMLVFIVGTANFYNFMDGINGIAGITGLVGFAGLAWWAFGAGRGDIGAASLALAGGCAGFLPLNMPRAKVFMGDIGSVLLGFCFGLFAVGLAGSVLDFVVLCSLLFTFYADELCTMLQRLRQGDSFFQAHRKHLYQVLVNELGVAHWKVSVGYGVVQIGVFLAILYLSRYDLTAVLAGLMVCAVSWFVVDWKVKKKAEAELTGEGKRENGKVNA